MDPAAAEAFAQVVVGVDHREARFSGGRVTA
jgi:hypothetical protein